MSGSTYGRITRVFVRTFLDEFPDLEWLGEFSRTPGEYPVLHERRNGYYQYFNACNVENLRQALENYKRTVEFVEGRVWSVGVKAVADISESSAPENGQDTVESSGLWGIESDSDADYLEEVSCNELLGLKDELMKRGFTKGEVAEAFKDAEWCEDDCAVDRSPDMNDVVRCFLNRVKAKE